MRKVILVILSLITMIARADVYSFRTLDKARPLYGNSINVLLEDHEGYLWIGASKGLFRYDGYEMCNQNELMPSSMSTREYVTNLQEDAGHYLWVTRSTASDYAVLTPRRESIDTRAYMNSLGLGTDKQFLIHVDNRGDLWRITQDSVYYYNYIRSELKTYATPGLSSASNHRISAKAFKGTLYIIDGKVLYIFNMQSGIWAREELDLVLPSFGSDTEGVMLADNYLDRRGGLWIYSLFSEDILYRDPASKEWTHITLPQDGQVMQNSIRRVVEDSENGIWIATDHRGLFLYTLSGNLEHFVHDPADNGSISSDNINAVMVDSHHTLWLGYYKTGISYCHPWLDLVKKHEGPYGDVTAMLAEPDGTRWIGTDGRGLWRQTPDGHVSQFNKLPNLTIADLQHDAEGHLWVATYDHGLYLITSDSNVRHYSSQTGELPHDAAGRIAFDGYGRLWVSSQFSAFYCFNPKTETYQIYKGDTGADLIGEALCYNAHNNQIILGTYYGLWVQDLQSDEGHYMLGARDGSQPLHEFKENNLLTYKEAPLVWMSHDEGITVWDTRADTLYLISRSEGLPPMIQSFREDGQHNIWATSVSGLSMIQVLEQKDGSWEFKVRNLLTADNALGVSFNPYAGTATSQGMMLFGGPNGYSEFDSRSILSVATGRLMPRFSTILLKDKVVFEEDLLHLAYDDHPLTFHFFTGNPLNASDVNYSYRVKGLNDGWIDTHLNFITLLTLPPGDYEFEVKAIGLNAEWSQVCSLPIHVSPPWWSSTWMRLIYAIMLVAIGVLLVWLTKVRQHRKAVIERKMLIREQQSRLAEVKLQFFTDISHDLRTPLTLIISPLEQLMKEQLPDPVLTRLHNMYKNAQQLLAEVNKLLDFRKIDVGAEHLMLGQPADILAFVRDLCDQYCDVVHEGGMTLSAQFPAETVQMAFDQDKLRKIMYNLLGNAIKHSPHGGAIRVSCTVDEQGVVFDIADQGQGVPDAEKEKIFDLFYQSQGAHMSSGNGIGLHIARQLVELHGGRIWVEDNNPQGAVFRFMLPLSLAEQAAIPVAEPVVAKKEEETDELTQMPDLKGHYTVLVVDDNRDLCDFIREGLCFDFNVLCAHNGEEALECLDRETVDLIVSDVMMPGINGLELCNRVKSNVQYSHIPVILLTARVAEESQIEGLSQGADDYLTKPFQMERLKLRISKFIEWSQRRHQEFDAQLEVEPRSITITSLDEQFLRKAIDLVEVNMQDASFGVEALAQGVGMSRSQLYKKLVAVTGKSPLDFIRNLRMKQARQLLERSQMQISEVAYQVGYNTLKSFSENFKQEFGMTPSDFVRNKQ